MSAATTKSAPAPLWQRPSPLPQRFETDRLVLRWYTHDDAQALFDAVSMSRDSFLPWLPWAKNDHLSLAASHYSIEHFQRELAKPTCDGHVIGVFEKDTGDLVAGTGFHDVKPATGQCEIGYWTRVDRQRRGLCTEATAAMLSWCFTPQSENGWGFRRVEIKAAAGNAASCGVPRKLGLTQEGLLRQDRLIENRGLDDTLIWGVLKDEWDIPRMRLRGS